MTAFVHDCTVNGCGTVRRARFQDVDERGEPCVCGQWAVRHDDTRCDLTTYTPLVWQELFYCSACGHFVILADVIAARVPSLR